MTMKSRRGKRFIRPGCCNPYAWRPVGPGGKRALFCALGVFVILVFCSTPFYSTPFEWCCKDRDRNRPGVTGIMRESPPSRREDVLAWVGGLMGRCFTNNGTSRCQGSQKGCSGDGIASAAAGGGGGGGGGGSTRYHQHVSDEKMEEAVNALKQGWETTVLRPVETGGLMSGDPYRMRPPNGVVPPAAVQAEGNSTPDPLSLSSRPSPDTNSSMLDRLLAFGVPHGPHIEDCGRLARIRRELDSRRADGSLPIWAEGAGLGSVEQDQALETGWIDREEEAFYINRTAMAGPYPPWVVGSDEENLILTRRVQHDLWMHQHPRNCSDPSVKFLIMDFGPIQYFGTGAQLNRMMGALAVAVSTGRVLVTVGFDRANHDGCKGRHRSNWSCYFAPETSLLCRMRALFLWRRSRRGHEDAVMTMSFEEKTGLFFPNLPRNWGEPWFYMEKTDQIEGKVIAQTKVDPTFWWRSQALRYMMRYQSEYLCRLLNDVRHEMFGDMVAREVIETGLYDEIFFPGTGRNMQSVREGAGSPAAPSQSDLVRRRTNQPNPSPAAAGPHHFAGTLAQRRWNLAVSRKLLQRHIRKKRPYVNEAQRKGRILLMELGDDDDLTFDKILDFKDVERGLSPVDHAQDKTLKSSANEPMPESSEWSKDMSQFAQSLYHKQDPYRELLRNDSLQSTLWFQSKPYVPRPLVSVHVRMGDKASEMRIATFEEYMKLAEDVRREFPQTKYIWLSSEMQEVIDNSKNYTTWTFFYTRVKRQTGTEAMYNYEAEVGWETSTKNAFVNLIIASEADFFVGALGSTWCLILDELRSTNGRISAGYLTVNRDRYW
ncbi:hypothetical protein CBR_g57532 [Chara braunii]|uniref:GT23 domain-containing protein n=1 Tax=Chara braunii TaxID=69332 RepID=A0A388MEB6_CHABU|nr:hypothetical protein CBR_g57532 [Chara braunii]|eukprot:GBG92853.1 hypothetical protein CBR_g57532 [Chara braunii]